MVKLSTPQIRALAEAASVNVAQLTQFRSNTLRFLRTAELIEKTPDGYVITTDGLAVLRELNPTASIAECHLTINDFYSATADDDATEYLPEHLTVGFNGRRVKGHFKNSDREFDFTGVVIGEYLTAMTHGFRVPMFEILTDDHGTIFTYRGRVELDSWHPTFIQGTDDSDPVLEVLGTAIVNGETVLWVNSPNGEFTIQANKPLTQRYWRAFPVQATPTKWVAERKGLNLWRNEDVAIAHESTPVFPTRFGAVGALIAKLTDDVALCENNGYSSKSESALLADITARPNANTFRAGNVQWTIRGW